LISYSHPDRLGVLGSILFVWATFKFTGPSRRDFGMDLSQHPLSTCVPDNCGSAA
jgi:hypothetical protein